MMSNKNGDIIALGRWVHEKYACVCEKELNNMS